MAGTDDEFAEYFRARSIALRRLAYTLCGDWHTADDLVQVTFVKLYRHWKRLPPEGVEPYARRILVNTFLSHHRDRRREQVVAEPPDAVAPEVGLASDDGADRRAELVAALRALPARQRAVVALRHLEDMSIAEVAAALGMAEGTVKSQAARGVAALRRALGTPQPTPTRE